MLNARWAVVLAMLASPASASAAGFEQGAPLAAGGEAVAVSQDGSVAVVGDSTIGFAGGVGSNVGAIEILARSGGTWQTTGAIYQQNNQSHTGNYFGASVAISPDGSTVVAGAPGGQEQSGQKSRVEVFSVSVDGAGVPHWTRDAVLASVFPGHFGTSVAVTRVAGPHTIVAVGAPDSSPFVDGAFRSGAGEVYSFTDPVSPQDPGGLGDVYGTELVDTTDGTSFSALGTSVGMSGDGATIVAGAPHRGAQFHAGAVDEFTSAAGTYSAGTQVLAGLIAGGNLGTSVAISNDGSTAIAGEPMLDVFPKVTGAAHVLALGASASTCAAQLPATITAADGGQPGDAFGTSVALSADGKTALVGAPYAGFSPGTPFGSEQAPGSVYVEDASLGAAHPAEQVLVPAHSDNGSHFGQAVSITGDTLIALAGAPGDTSAHGGTFTFGWGFPWTRAQRPELCPAPQPTPSPTPTPTPAPPPPAPAASPAAQLAVACSGRRLTLLDVVARKGRVALLGAADASLIGRQVSVLFDNRATVAHATVGPDGFFRATAKLPPKAVRATNRARYVAVSGTDRSLFLKLTRRVLLDPPSANAGKVTLTGTITPPLTKPRAQIVVRQQVTCGGSTVVAHAHPGPGGRFRITVPAPKNAKAAIYRLATSVRKTARNPRRYPSFSLPQVVAL